MLGVVVNTCIPSYLGGIGKRNEVCGWTQPKTTRPYLEITEVKRPVGLVGGGGLGWPSRCEA
jgi:hypothetical protein